MEENFPSAYELSKRFKLGQSFPSHQTTLLSNATKLGQFSNLACFFLSINLTTGNVAHEQLFSLLQNWFLSLIHSWVRASMFCMMRQKKTKNNKSLQCAPGSFTTPHYFCLNIISGTWLEHALDLTTTLTTNSKKRASL